MSFLKGMAMVDTAAMLAPQVTIQVVAITPADTITIQVRDHFLIKIKILKSQALHRKY